MLRNEVKLIDDLKMIRKLQKSFLHRVLNLETRRCIDEAECSRSRRLIHQNLCVQDCPTGYTTRTAITDENENKTSFTCQKCYENCPKICTPPELRKNLHFAS